MARIDGAWLCEAAELGPSSATQFKAIAWLRWWLFVNSFRRKGGKGEVVARILLFPFIAIIAIGPVVGSGVGAYFSIREKVPWGLSLLMWGVSAGWVFISMATTLQPDAIDLSLLLRFPIRFASYVITRFFFGLLSPPNVIGTLALAAAAIGVEIAQPNLFLWAALDFFFYALMMILMLRMVLLWLDRWLAQRRTREIVGVLFTLFFLSFQFLNVQLQNWLHSGRDHHSGFARFAVLLHIYNAARPMLGALPPALAANSVAAIQSGAVGRAIALLAGVLAYGVVFGGLYCLRLRGAFRGENFNEAPARAAAKKSLPGARRAAVAGSGSGAQIAPYTFLAPAFLGCVEKELRYLVRGPSLLLTALTPLVLVGLYVTRMGSSEFLLPGAMAYTLFAMLPLLYNVLGQDAAGAQLYLLAPTPIRTVFLAKNLVTGGLIVTIAGAAAVIVLYRRAPSAPIVLATALWFVFVLFANLSAGNSRSLAAPAKVDLGKIQRRQGASQVSVLIVLGVLLGSLAIGFALMWTCRYLGYEWVAPAILALMAVAAEAVYLRRLNYIEESALRNRDVLVEVLGKG